MTGKQIMIDGVDVSKCIFFDKNYKEDGVQIKNFCELQYISCKEFDCANCYFKKWKRKEQECEELKKWKENVANLFDKTCRCKYLNEGNAHCSFYNKECIAINQCLYKNQQTLTEIKELLLKTPTDSPMHCVNAKSVILQKISECEAEYEN